MGSFYQKYLIFGKLITAGSQCDVLLIDLLQGNIQFGRHPNQAEEQPLAGQASSFDHHVSQHQTQRKDGLSNRFASCHGWKSLQFQCCCFFMQCLSWLKGDFWSQCLLSFPIISVAPCLLRLEQGSCFHD